MQEGYTKSDIHNMLAEASNNMPIFYKQGFVNYKGRTSDTNERYTEVTAEWLLARLDLLESIPTITRENTYKTPSHDGIHLNNKSNREEEIIAMEVFRQGTLPILGTVLDYQTPLKNKSSDCAGKIDLLSYDGRTLRILELKEPDSKESMLRCVLEGYTYLKTVNIEKLLKDFELPLNTNVLASPLVFQNKAQHNEMQENHIWLKKLMLELDCKPYYISKTGNKYEIKEE